jgi:hypothetical protein
VASGAIGVMTLRTEDTLPARRTRIGAKNWSKTMAVVKPNPRVIDRWNVNTQIYGMTDINYPPVSVLKIICHDFKDLAKLQVQRLLRPIRIKQHVVLRLGLDVADDCAPGFVRTVSSNCLAATKPPKRDGPRDNLMYRVGLKVFAGL